MIATQKNLNGIDTQLIHDLASQVSSDSRKGIAKFAVTTAWKGGTRTETIVDGWSLGSKQFAKSMRIATDEPTELGGANTAANPQECLMAAFNACMMVGYVANASLKGIELESVEIETKGQLDLRGFLGLDNTVKPGYDTLHYTVRIKGAGTTEQFQEIHEIVSKTSPNRWNIANSIRLTSDLVVE